MNTLNLKVILPKKDAKSEAPIHRPDKFPASLNELCANLRSIVPIGDSERYRFRHELPNGTINRICSEKSFKELTKTFKSIKLYLEIVKADEMEDISDSESFSELIKPMSESKSDIEFAFPKSDIGQGLPDPKACPEQENFQLNREIVQLSPISRLSEKSDSDQFVRIDQIRLGSSRIVKKRNLADDQQNEEKPSKISAKSNLSKESDSFQKLSVSTEKKQADVCNELLINSDLRRIVESILQEKVQGVKSEIAEIRELVVTEISQVKNAVRDQIGVLREEINQRVAFIKSQYEFEDKLQFERDIVKRNATDDERSDQLRNNFKNEAKGQVDSEVKNLRILFEEEMRSLRQDLQKNTEMLREEIKTSLGEKTKAELDNEVDGNSNKISKYSESQLEQLKAEMRSDYKVELEHQVALLKKFIEEKRRSIEIELNNSKSEFKAGMKQNSEPLDLKDLEERVQTLEANYQKRLNETSIELKTQLENQLSNLRSYFDDKAQTIHEAQKRKLEQTREELKSDYDKNRHENSLSTKVNPLSDENIEVHQTTVHKRSEARILGANEPDQTLPLVDKTTAAQQFEQKSLQEEETTARIDLETEIIVVTKPFKAEVTEEPSDPDAVAPGSDYEVIFTLRNSGKNSWPEDTALACVSGIYPTYSLRTGLVGPGEQYLMILNLKAPKYPGVYKNAWRLQYLENKKKSYFGPAISFELSVEGPGPEEEVSKESYYDFYSEVEIKQAKEISAMTSGDMKDVLEFIQKNETTMSTEELIELYRKQMNKE